MMASTQGKYHFYQDSGHGWLEVPRPEVKASGIDVTPYSYYDRRTDMIYLEEDVDMVNFMKATGLKLKDTHTQASEMCPRLLPRYIDAK